MVGDGGDNDPQEDEGLGGVISNFVPIASHKLSDGDVFAALEIPRCCGSTQPWPNSPFVPPKVRWLPTYTYAPLGAHQNGIKGKC